MSLKLLSVQASRKGAKSKRHNFELLQVPAEGFEAMGVFCRFRSDYEWIYFSGSTTKLLLQARPRSSPNFLLFQPVARMLGWRFILWEWR